MTREVWDTCARLSGNGLKWNFDLNENPKLLLKEWVVLNLDFTPLRFNYLLSLFSCLKEG